MTLFSKKSMEATGGKVMYCLFCREKMIYTLDINTYRCTFCGRVITKDDKTVPYQLMADFFNKSD
jgi:ribosomal protein L37AE/L43A